MGGFFWLFFSHPSAFWQKSPFEYASDSLQFYDHLFAVCSAGNKSSLYGWYTQENTLKRKYLPISEAKDSGVYCIVNYKTQIVRKCWLLSFL